MDESRYPVVRLFIEGEWFDPLPPGATYEYEFEALVMQHRTSLFPGFLCARFDPLLWSLTGNVKPDMILVDQSYRGYYIVEAELSTHSISSHVGPQLEKIHAARVGVVEADWLADRNPGFERGRLQQLFKEVPHRTLLLVNAPTPHWDDRLKSLPTVQRALIEVYRSKLNRTLLRINGDQPELPGSLISTLSPGSGWLRYAYKVDVPSSIPDATTSIDIVMGDQALRWRVKRLGSDKYLFPQPANRLPTSILRLVLARNDVYRIED